MIIRSLIAVLLAVVLALTSQSMAVARGSAAATGQMVLCTGTGPVAVFTDADGQPTSAPHICPDSALNVLLAVPHRLTVTPARIVHFDLAETHATATLPILRRERPAPRAPPSSL